MATVKNFYKDYKEQMAGVNVTAAEFDQLLRHRVAKAAYDVEHKDEVSAKKKIK